MDRAQEHPEWTLDSAWAALLDCLCEDCQELGAMGSDAPPVPRVTPTTIEIRRSGDNGWVCAEKRPQDGYILVRQAPGNVSTTTELRFVPGINKRVQERLLLGKEELEIWEVSRLILLPVLFTDHY